MRSHAVKCGLGVVCLAIVVPALRAEPPADNTAQRDPYALAIRLDRHIEKLWEANKAVAAPRAGDAEFMRRVYLDIAGRIPRTAEVRDFLDDKDPAKRRKVVEKLLDDDRYVRLYVSNFTNVWRAVMIPHSNDQQVQFLEPQMEAWLRRRIRDNVPYDQMVRDLLTANVNNGQGVRGKLVQVAQQLDPNALAFYQANEMKPENLAAASARLFLGTKIECAQCHNHPFAKWTREQFWEFAAFFASVAPPQQVRGQPQPQRQPGKELRELKIPNTSPEKMVKAKFLDGKEPEWKEDSISRAVLADWITSPKNPYFARAMANRLWGHFFGIGIVDPVDEFGENNPASHPELLDELAQAFADSKFDPKFLIKAITATRAYQTTSEVTDKSQEDPRLFARMALKGLSPEQLFDSLAVAAGYKGEDPASNPRGVRGDGSPRGEFLVKFANYSDRRTEYQTSILQALMLMNGKFVADADTVDLTNENKFGTLTGIYDAPSPSLATTKGKLNALYLATLAREMRAEEESRLVRYVDKGGPSGDKKKAFADVFWALLNSSEFILNH